MYTFTNEVMFVRTMYLSKIKNRIAEMDNGSAIIIGNFLDIANYDAIKNALSKLEKEKVLIRVMRGVYKKPNYNNTLQIEIPAKPDDVAKAIAKNNNWNIIPKGDSALNYLGLSTQVPAVYTYVSDGPSKTYQYGKNKIKFYKRSNKYINGMSMKTGLIIEAIKTLGTENVGVKERQIIASKLSDSEKMKLAIEGRQTARWINEEIVKILETGGYDVRGSKIINER